MPQDITDVDAFTDPVVAPAGADAADRTYVVTIAQGLANRTRWLRNVLGAVAYPASKTILIQPFGVGINNAGTLPAWDQAAAAPPYSRSLVNSAFLAIDIGTHLRTPCVLTRVRARVKPGAARTGTNKMKLETYYHRIETFLSSAMAAATYDDGTTAEQWISTGTISQEIDRSVRIYSANITAGNDAGTNLDALYAIELTFTDLGPRNF